ncbi:hypothetical protein PENFLA_c007G05305 [Penicillium flavigenum]|uniref:Uncharacterized protein n=1 Tax=Penicillium flavigenum TaxID=254877 RepID=A0A1V6TJC5_9EURO|nr:hypothetical protein PENFLA_c007G05305 [Penicillium flavigenum]
MPKAEALTGKPKAQQRLTVDIHTLINDVSSMKGIGFATSIAGITESTRMLICLDHKHGCEEQFPNSISFFKNAHIIAGINLVR